MRTIGDLYEAYVSEEKNFSDVSYFYGSLPKTHLDAVETALSREKLSFDSNKMSKLKQILTKHHEKLGLLTPKVASNISQMDNGIVLTGQQATIFGGVGIIANKIATIVNLSDISKEMEKQLVPMFLVNTHDGVQPEITTIHLPNFQTSASKSIINSSSIEGCALHTIKSNDYQWLKDSINVITNIFNEFKSSISDRSNQKLFSERVSHIISFIRETYRSSLTLGEWFTLIWGVQANILNDWGVIFFPSSNPGIRELLIEGYYPFLKSRKEYIEEFNRASAKIESMGFHPTTTRKDSNYSPFFYECPNDGYRVKLRIVEENNELKFQGKCPIDKSDYNFSVDKNNLDLSSLSLHLSPRLDTNQAQLQSILPVNIRVSGPGEINYNAQVIPAVRKIGIQLPIYMKYTRVLYNTPWIEKITKDPQLLQYSLFESDFFKSLGAVAKARRKSDFELGKDAWLSITNKVLAKMDELKKINLTQNNLIEKYKSWQFGMYDVNHQWQEVSWPWFVMASVTGLQDYLASYRRFYSKISQVGGIGYINSNL